MLEEKLSYSQEGEDILLERIIGNIEFNGSFVDIGAHHPIKLSNTYKFYKAGWRGINIEATPGSKEVFNKIRPEDINIEVPISDREEELTFYVFNYSEFNSFSEQHVLEWNGRGDVKVIDKIKLKTSTFNSILEEHFPDKKIFDLMSIDVEGLDLRILKTINFEKYSFNFLIVEDPLDIADISNGETYKFLISKGFKLLSKLYYSSIYYFDFNSFYG